MVRLLALGLSSLLISAQAFAFTSVSNSTDEQPSRWSLDAAIQAHSIAGPSSPLFGLGTSYNILNSWSLGLRGFVPVSHTTDNATYSVQVFTRIRLVNALNSEFFIEPEYAYNFYNFLPFESYGIAVGVLNNVSKSLAIGISGGIEAANDVIDSIGLEKSSNTVIYPKVSLIARFGF